MLNQAQLDEAGELNTRLYSTYSLKQPDDTIGFTKNGVDPRLVGHFFGQLLDSHGKTTGLEFCLELVLPYLGVKPIIGSSWVSYP
jgi:hypothetical protein